MTCPHQTDLTPRAFRCQLIDMQLAGPANPNYPCPQCQREWTNGQPPTADQLTPTLQSLVQINQPPWDESQPSRGLGDTLASILSAVGIRKRRGCGCGRRQAWLNRLLPYHP